jgi:hypothetical protein
VHWTQSDTITRVLGSPDNSLIGFNCVTHVTSAGMLPVFYIGTAVRKISAAEHIVVTATTIAGVINSTKKRPATPVAHLTVSVGATVCAPVGDAAGFRAPQESCAGTYTARVETPDAQWTPVPSTSADRRVERWIYEWALGQRAGFPDPCSEGLAQALSFLPSEVDAALPMRQLLAAKSFATKLVTATPDVSETVSASFVPVKVKAEA